MDGLTYGSADLCDVVLMVSGVQLVKGVFAVRRFFRERNQQQRINTISMTIHAFAFGLYLLAVTISLFVFSLYVIFPLNETLENIYTVTSLLLVLTSFLSQLFLVFIFWELGNKLPE